MSALSEEFLVVTAPNSAASQRFNLEPELWLEAPADAFVQVNWGTNQELVRRLTEGARARGLRSFADLYAGAGNFSLVLARAGLTGISVEEHPAASAAASRAARAQGLTSVEVVSSDAAAWLARAPRPFPYELVLLDPPRAGARELVPELTRRKPSVIAYCACDPVTLARDLGQLVGAGYHLEEIQAFDMFPGTHHVEVLAWLVG
jgi:23S rRNA (uracil1939-C5)-methyltransferase